MGWLTSKEVGRKFKAVWMVLLLIAGLCYSGWLLIDDLSSYGYDAAHATEIEMKVKSGSSRSGDEMVVAYSFVVGDKSYRGQNLFGPAARQRAHYFAMRTFEGWYADWAKEPVVYYDASNPERSRMVVGLTSSLGAVFLPALLLAGTFGWLCLPRKIPEGELSSVFDERVGVMGWGLGGFVLSALAGQSIYFTKLWVEEGWMLHLGMTLCTAAGIVVGWWRAQVAKREFADLDAHFAHMEAEIERHRVEYERDEARKGARRR